MLCYKTTCFVKSTSDLSFSIISLSFFKDHRLLFYTFYFIFKNKCTQYWPENDKVLDVGPCKMKLLEETVYAFYTRRVLSVMEKNVSSGE